jgi:predicted RNA-binding Zn ribbon-like protein
LQKVSPETRRLDGGELCLDFANSVDWAGDGAQRPANTDVLTAPDLLARWGKRLGVASPDDLLHVTGRELSAARSLRAAIHTVFTAIANGDAPDEESLGQLARDYEEAVVASELAAGDRRMQFEWVPDDPRRIRFAVAVSALDLLRDEARLRRVRMCPGNNCGWLFLDTSGRRRWCSMEVCGSRAKMRRLYERRRRSRSGDTRR